MSPRPIVLALLLVIGALLAGCGDDDGDAGPTTGPNTAGAKADYDITGSWRGELSQKGLAPFTVVATIGSLDDPSQNTVRYTGIDCGGNWTYLGREGAAFRFNEVIDRGAGGKCKGTGTVSLTPFSADGVDYNFQGGGVQSVGVLRRSG